MKVRIIQVYPDNSVDSYDPEQKTFKLFDTLDEALDYMYINGEVVNQIGLDITKTKEFNRILMKGETPQTPDREFIELAASGAIPEYKEWSLKFNPDSVPLTLEQALPLIEIQKSNGTDSSNSNILTTVALPATLSNNISWITVAILGALLLFRRK